MTDRARPGLVALYDIRPGNVVGQFLQPRSPHGPSIIYSRKEMTGEPMLSMGSLTNWILTMFKAQKNSVQLTSVVAVDVASRCQMEKSSQA